MCFGSPTPPPPPPPSPPPAPQQPTAKSVEAPLSVQKRKRSQAVGNPLLLSPVLGGVDASIPGPGV